MAELLLSVSPPRVRAAAAEVDRLELALMEADDESTQMAYAAALAEFADAGGYEIEVVWDTCCTSALGIGFDKAKYRELETLSGGEQKRLVLEYLLAGPDQVLLLDEPDNFLDVPGKVWLEGRIRASPEDDPVHQPRPRAAGEHRDAGGHRRAGQWRAERRQHRVDAPRRVRVVPRGAARPLRPVRGAATPLGRGARQAEGAGAALQGQGGVQRRARLPVQGRPDPAAQVRGGRSADRPAARATGHHAAHGRAHRQACGGLRAAGADGPDGAVRPRGLVRRAGGRARLERLRQVALPPPARRGGQRPGRRAPAGRRDAGDTRPPHRPGQAGRSRPPGVVRADPRASRARRADAARDPAPW